MKKTLQDQYLSIKEGKGHKGVFLNEAKRQFPNIVRNAATYEEAVSSLKTKNIISENVIGLPVVSGYEPRKKESFESAFESFLAEAKKKENEDEKVKAEEKKVSKPVEKDLEKQYDKTDDKNPDNLIFDQIMMGYYAELKDPKNADKTMQQIKDIVLKNLSKDPIHYTKDGQFGVKGLGYTTEAPGLGTPKEAKGKYKSSGYGNLNESNNLNEETKLRKVIREIINEELEEAKGGGNYGMMTINTANTKGSGKRYIPDSAFLSQEIIDKFNFSNPGPNAPTRDESLQIPHIKFLTKPEGAIMLISTFLYNALQTLEKGRTSREKEMGKNELEKLVSDIDPMVRALIKKNVEPKTSLGNYHAVNMPIEREKGVGVKIPLDEATRKELEEIMLRESSLNQENSSWEEKWAKSAQDKETVMYFKKNMTDEEWNNFKSKYSEDIKIALMEAQVLKESVEKELAEINKMAEYEVLEAKLQKLNDAIEKRQSQLTKLDEDEDMKALTDKKKVKEIQKDIKVLERAKGKLEKTMSKSKVKTDKKEIIDEDEPIDEVELNEAPPSEVLDKESEKSAQAILKSLQTIDKIQFKNLEEEDEEY